MIRNIDHISGAGSEEEPEPQQEQPEVYDESIERPKRAFYMAVMAFVTKEKREGVAEQDIKEKIGKEGQEPEKVTEARKALREVLGDTGETDDEIARLEAEAFELGLKTQPLGESPEKRTF